ncbi:hypothetical protein ACP70R_048753 [Stipagrostis hirtigluma subsp. patula]
MLSLRGARPACGGGGGAAEDVEELEEGEAHPEDDDAGEGFFDPDVALAYIDEKLQHVLGHLQKDFEGGVSAEILGSKFGGYGSFLPAYQCSPPSLPLTGVPSTVAHSRTSRSPYQPSAERMVSIPPNNSSGLPSASDICKKERCSSTNAMKDSVADSESMDSSFNGSDLKSLIEVGSENALPRKNAAIYSGLGLDISSSSSMEESPGGLGGLSPEFSNSPCESPRTILQIMTCFPVPGGFFLSPLPGNILHLTNEVAPLLKKLETHLDIDNVPKAIEGCSQPSFPPGDVRGYVAEKTKSGNKKKEPKNKRTEKDKDDTCSVLKKEVNIEMPACQETISGMPVPTTESKDESHFAEESTRNKCISRPSQQYESARLKEQTDENDLATVKAEAIQVEAINYTENSALGNSGTGYLAPKGKPKSEKRLNPRDLMERTNAHSKLENKRGIDENGHKTSRKTKREDRHRFDRDWKHECDFAGGEVPDEAKALPTKAKAMKSPGKPGSMSFGRKEKSQPRPDGQDIQTSVGQVVHLPTKDGKQEVFPTSVKFDASKMKAQLRRSSVENGVQHDTVRQAISNPSDASNMVAFALKEARDLKHKANHLKNEGLELESTGLYFEAALKFLHVASLLETPNFDSSRPGDSAQSMKMYSETAKLCKFCAHEYERCKKVAAAALAYKCVEVAYLKAAYYKHPSASKDQQELQAVVQIAPAESSPSSASDNDNMNSLGFSKSHSTKYGISPQVAGNHLPLAVRNQAHLLRLLAYINDVNCAFDATCKSQVAITSAAGSLERENGVGDGLASVKTVLDFHFNNVNELLRLVRLSMESISS